MKKLMTMIAAVGMAFGLFADGVTLPNGTSFEDLTPGVVTTDQLTDATWTATEGVTATVTEYTSGRYPQRPAQFEIDDQDNYLGVKGAVGKDFLTRAIEAQNIVSNLYVDTLVKFTASDEDIDLTNVTNGAKIAIWVKADEEADAPSTNLMVTAGFYQDGAIIAKTYDCGALPFALETWHRLTIKAISDITADSGIVGFVIFLDGDQQAAVACTDIEEAKAAFTGLTLTTSAADWMNKGSLFLTMSDSDQTLSAIAISGQGGIDDISFTDVQPFNNAKDTEFYTVTWGDDIASVKVGDVDVVKGAARVVTGKVETFAYTAAAGYISDSTNITGEANGEYTISAAKLAATAKIDGEDKTFSDLDSAIEAINGASETAELTLGDAAGAIEIFNENDAEILIDLAGKNVASLTIMQGEVTLTNSVTETCSVVEGALTSANDGTLTVTEANIKVDGKVTGDDECLYLNGGKYLASANEKDNLDAYAPDGFEFTEKDGYYELEAEKVYVAKIGDDEYETLKAALEAAKTNDTIEVFADVEENQVRNDVPVKVIVNKGVKIEFNDTPGNYSWLVFADLTLDGEGTICKPIAAGGHSMIQVQKSTNPNLVVNGTLTFTVGVEGQADTVTSPSNAISVEGGTATINGGTFINYKTGNDGRCVRAEGDGSVTINGGSFSTMNDYGTDKRNLPVNTKGSYSTGAGGTVTIPGTSTATFNKDETAFCAAGYGTKEKTTGVWSVEELYTITFTVGDVVETNKIFKGDAVAHADPTAPTGYNFTGWQPAIVTPAAANADYVAEFAPIAYTITYTTGNGATVTNGVTEYTIATETFALPVAADIDMSKVEGVTFAGWTNETSDVVVTQVEKGTTGNLEFFAKWEAVAPAEKDPTEDKPEDIPADQTAGDRYGTKVPTTLANVSAKSIATWAQNNGKLVKGAEILENAFLLNCENTEAAINAAKENFKATSITVNSDGTVTVGEPEGEYNGKIEQWGKIELEDDEWVKDLEGAKFFELKLVPANLN